jgi:hypothetical protein
MTSVTGRPIPNAPPSIIANADNRFGSACTSRPDMPLLHGAPTGIAHCPTMNNQKNIRTESLPFPNPKIKRLSVMAGWTLMVNDRLTPAGVFSHQPFRHRWPNIGGPEVPCPATYARPIFRGSRGLEIALDVPAALYRAARAWFGFLIAASDPSELFVSQLDLTLAACCNRLIGHRVLPAIEESSRMNETRRGLGRIKRRAAEAMIYPPA